MVAFSSPACRHERPHKRSQASSTEQDADAESGPARRINAVAMHCKLTGAHHRKDYPAWPDHELPSFRKDCRQQSRMTADIADALHHGREVDEIARPKRRSGLGMRFAEMHSPYQKATRQQ